MNTRTELPPAFASGTAIKLVIGAFLTVFGILLTLQNLGIAEATPILRFWPVVVIAVGAILFAWRTSPLFGVALMVIGAWMIAYEFNLVHFTIFALWPLLLIIGGVAMVRRAFGWNVQPIGTSRGGAVAILSSRNVVETSRDFKEGSLVALLGGCQMDLTRAAMTKPPAVIDATAIFGGIEIIAPDDWEVRGEVVPFLGGFEMKVQPTVSRAGGQLIVRGVALFGGIEVKSARRTS